MFVKLKLNCVEFYECVKCYCIVYSKDLSIYVSECFGVENYILLYVYVKDVVFYGVVFVVMGK